MRRSRETVVEHCRLGSDLGSLCTLLRGASTAWLLFRVAKPWMLLVAPRQLWPSAGLVGELGPVGRRPGAGSRGSRPRLAKGAGWNITKHDCLGLFKGAATICSLLDQQKEAQADSEVEEEANRVGASLFSLCSVGSPTVFL